VVVKFTEQDARMLGLVDKNQSMYKKDPSSMYFARTITRAQRRYGPGVLGVDALDTYEARDIEPEVTGFAAEIARTKPPDDDPKWAQAGSAKDAEQVAERKIAEMREKQQTRTVTAAKDMTAEALDAGATAERVNLTEHEDKQAHGTTQERPAPKVIPHYETSEFPENAEANIIIWNGVEYTFSEATGNYQKSETQPTQPTQPAAAKPELRPKPVFGRRSNV
jgi:hypothetical protein